MHLSFINSSTREVCSAGKGQGQENMMHTSQIMVNSPRREGHEEGKHSLKIGHVKFARLAQT